MSDTILPMRPSPGSAGAELARIDAAAADLLIAGLAPNLQTARIEVILADLQAQRDRFAEVLADLRRRGSEGRIDDVAADAALVLSIAQGIVQIDALITHARASMREDARAPSPILMHA